jgi:hypothetical protein
MQTFTRWGFAAQHPELCSKEENEAFRAIGYTIGAMMVFPGNRKPGCLTINQVRGLHPKIKDRFDLTIECIRRYYVQHNGPNPLGATLDCYQEFFDLFERFKGYVDFFLLQDLVSDDYSAVRFFAPFDDFKTPAVPQDYDTYMQFRRRSIEFIESRNRRIERYAASTP